MKDVEAFMQKLGVDMDSRKQTDFRIARIKREIRMMSLHRESIERSRDEQKIGEFNRRFISRLAELSRIMQTTGFSDRDEAARIVREIKKK